jgi:photosystem II stability/assembly factor-like uncharacterized protein
MNLTVMPHTLPKSIGVIICVLTLCNFIASAQPFDWQPANGPYGGTITALTVGSNDEIVAGTITGSLYRSVNNGEHWNRVTGNGLPAERIISILFSRAGSMFVVTSSYYRGLSDQQLFRSNDNGQNWLRLNDSIDGPVALDSTGTIYAGKHRSTDDGMTWVSMPELPANFHSIAINERSELFGITYHYGQIYKSGDGGSSWTELSPSSYHNSIFSIATGPKGKVYIGTENDGVFGSNDYGASWPAHYAPTSNSNVFAVAVNQRGHIFGGTLGPDDGTQIGGVIRSTNSGVRWTHHRTGLLNTTINVLAINSRGEIFAGTESAGVYRSTDNGESWLAVNQGIMSSTVPGIAIHQSGATFAAVDGVGVMRSSDHGASWELTTGGIVDFYVHDIGIGPQGTIFASGGQRPYYSGKLYRSTDMGTSWQALTGAWHAPRAFLFVGARSIYFGETFTSEIYHSTDDGETWQNIQRLPFSSGIRALAANGEDRLFAGTLYGHIARSTDTGQWDRVFYRSDSAINTIAISANGDLFAGTESGPYYPPARIVRSQDNGTTWDTIYIAPRGVAIRSLLFTHRGLLAGTSDGVLLSTDGGDDWLPVTNGLENLNVRSLGLDSSGVIFAGTDDGGIYRSVGTASVQQNAIADRQLHDLSCVVDPLAETVEVSFSVRSAGNILLQVHDMLGRRITTIINQLYTPGTYRTSWNAGGIPAGNYIVTINTSTDRVSRLIAIQ